jgi:hypothetical protein
VGEFTLALKQPPKLIIQSGFPIWTAARERQGLFLIVAPPCLTSSYFFMVCPFSHGVSLARLAVLMSNHCHRIIERMISCRSQT